MADSIIANTVVSAATLYFQVRDVDAQVWNGSAFEAYSTPNWGNYDVAMTEQGSSKIHVGAFPASISAGDYSYTIFRQSGASPAEGDPIIGSGNVGWDGTNFVDIYGVYARGDAAWTTATPTEATIAAAILATPANLLDTDASGHVQASNESDIATAVWAAGTRTLSSYGTLVADVATAVWAESTRTLTSISALTASLVSSIWAAATRSLTDYGGVDTDVDTLLTRLTATRALNLDNLDATISSRSTFDYTTNQVTPDNSAEQTTIAANVVTVDTVVDAIKVVTDKLNDTMEDDLGTYRFTSNALEQGPSSDATAANQTSIIAAIAALNDLSSADIATALQGAIVDGTLDFQTALSRIAAFCGGKITRTGTGPTVLEFYANDNTTVVMTLTAQDDGSARTRA